MAYIGSIGQAATNWGWSHAMTDGDGTILIVDDDAAQAENLRELIEFMDSPSVVTAAPGDWRQRLGERRLAALFVGPALSDPAVGSLLKDLEAIDPNVPVVVIGGDA